MLDIFNKNRKAHATRILAEKTSADAIFNI